MASGGNPFAPDVFDYRSRTTFNYFHQLIPNRREILDKLLDIIRGDKTEILHEIFGDGDVEECADITTSVYNAPLMAARKRFAPDPFYSAVDFDGLPTGAQRRLLENSVILSGLFGLLRPDDLIPEHTLSMAATVPGVGLLTTYWRPLISPFLNKTVRNKFVWDLLPELYRVAWDDNDSHAGRATVCFYNPDGKPVSDDTVYRGQLMNFIVRGPATEPEALETWKPSSGFKLSRRKSELDGKIKSIAFIRR